MSNERVSVWSSLLMLNKAQALAVPFYNEIFELSQIKDFFLNIYMFSQWALNINYKTLEKYFLKHSKNVYY